MELTGGYVISSRWLTHRPKRLTSRESITILDAALSGTPLPACDLSDPTISATLTVASHNNITLLVGGTLTGHDAIPPVLATRVKQLSVSATARALGVLAERDQLCGILCEINCSFCFLKGSATPYRCYPDPILREAGDIAVLIDERDAAEVISELIERGYRLLNVPWFGPRSQQGPKAVSLLPPSGVDIDLHTYVASSVGLYTFTPDKVNNDDGKANGPLDHIPTLESQFIHAALHLIDNCAPLTSLGDLFRLANHSGFSLARCKELAHSQDLQRVVQWALAEPIVQPGHDHRNKNGSIFERRPNLATCYERNRAVGVVAARHPVARRGGVLAYAELVFPSREFLELTDRTRVAYMRRLALPPKSRPPRTNQEGSRQ